MIPLQGLQRGGRAAGHVDLSETPPYSPRAAPPVHMNGPAETEAFLQFSSELRDVLEAELRRILDERSAWASELGDDVVTMVAAVRSLALRGGKRVRAALIGAALEGFGVCWRDAVPALVAIELLQTYFLIHDDWMDDDDVRRGGPSVHAMLRTDFGSPRAGDVSAILAGDFAAALATDILSTTHVPPARLVEALRLFARMQCEVIAGQLLDVRASGTVETMHDLKTGSYTVRGPLAIGAILAGASPHHRAALDALARPLGVAFQLRDDLLGTFGDPKALGKPVGGDLRQGKRTAVVAALDGDEAAKELLARVHGRKDASQEDVDVLLDHIERSGARARVEARLAALLDEAQGILEHVELTSHGAALLAGAIAALGVRET